MKQYLKYILILLIGITVGLIMGKLLLPSNDNQPIQKSPKIVEHIKHQIIRDTVEIKKIVTIPATIDSKQTDNHIQKDKNVSDSAQFDDKLHINNGDTINNVLTERLIDSRAINLPPQKKDSNNVDVLLGVDRNPFSDKIIVEFWDSPLHLTGYLLSRNRLKLYGFNPEESLTLARNENPDALTLKTSSFEITLEKSTQFKSLNIK